MSLTRRRLLAMAPAVFIGFSGCLNYIRTSPDEYELLDAGYTDGTAWLDVNYTGEGEGKIQYKLYIAEGDTLVETSSTQGSTVEPGGQHRLTASIDAIFDRSNASVGLRLVNTTSDYDSDVDIGSTSIETR